MESGGDYVDDFDDSDIDIDDLEEPDDLRERVGFRYCVRVGDPRSELVMFERFEGIRKLGSGSFGIIFLVRDPRLDREVALKLCRATSEEQRARLQREAQLIAKVSHPNIVTIHDVGCYESDRDDDEYDGAPFIVMERAEGETGKDLIVAQPHWREAVEFYQGAGRGLAAAHAAGVVHGDFKPSNVIKSSRGALVADFGLAHTLGSAEEHSGGTPGYMAPELLAGGGNSPFADQWAFCVSLWQTIEGVRPFDGKNPMSLLGSIEAGDANVGSPDAMPPRLRLALRRGLGREPAERWPSMDALVDELDVIMAQPSEPTPEERPRLPGGVLVHTILGGVLGALVVALLIGRSPAHEDDDARATDVVLRGPLCVLDGVPTADVSPELEAVCQHIRAGRLDRAFQVWTGVRAALEPKDGEPDELRREKYETLGTETRIVADTYADEARVMEANGGAAPLIKACEQISVHWEGVGAQDEATASELAPSD